MEGQDGSFGRRSSGFSTSRQSLESNVARHESMTLVETVGIGSLEIRCELDPTAPCPFGGIDRRIQKLLADAPPSGPGERGLTPPPHTCPHAAGSDELR